MPLIQHAGEQRKVCSEFEAAWYIEHVLGQPGLHRQTPCLEKPKISQLVISKNNSKKPWTVKGMYFSIRLFSLGTGGKSSVDV